MTRKIASILILSGVFLLISQFVSSNANKTLPAENLSKDNYVEPEPKRIKIPTLHINAPVVHLGLNRDRTLEVPKVGSDVGWYVDSPSPGAKGPAIMVGHFDSIKGQAVFYNLNKLKTGDLVEVERTDGTAAIFKIDGLERYSQDNFPTQKVYGPIDHAGIRLITCSGKYNFFKGRYSDNLVAYGSLVSISVN